MSIHSQGDAAFQSFKDSFYRECFARDEIKSMDELFLKVDERVNSKIALGMKRVIHLIVEKFDRHVKDQLRLLVSEEVELKFR